MNFTTTKKHKLRKVIDQLNKALKDPEYRLSWIANLAMAQIDSERWYREENDNKQYLNYKDKRTIANRGAEHFLALLDCDMGSNSESILDKSKQYTELELEAQDWLDRTDSMQFSEMELLSMFAAYSKSKMTSLTINHSVNFKFGFRDKLRIIFGKEVSVSIIANTEKEVQFQPCRIQTTVSVKQIFENQN